MGKISVESDNVFKIALPGYDVDNATPEQCSVHSGFNYPKIEEHLEGYSTVTLPTTIHAGDTVILTINHNYGYIPSWLVFLDDIDNHFTSDFARLPFTEGDPPYWQFRVDMSATQMKIIFYYVDSWGSGDMTVGQDGSLAGFRVGIKYQVWVNS